ncbi:MAG: Fe-S cluster assembly protein SufD [Candidatus Melainabacteria bacterium]|jgi:Fe-S cluster assembly protein SufD|nr:Fe-S cluster assembly protein SufD [Candidatus Melainabacteria bacterium]
MGETVKTIAKERVDEITRQTAEPAWLKDSRLKAFESYLKIPTPCNRDENWRRTEVEALDLAALNVVVNDSKEKQAAKEPAVVTAALAHLGKKLPYIYTTPESIEVGNADSALLSKGVIFCSLKTALAQHADLLSKYLSAENLPQPDFAENDKFYLMNQSLFNCGAFLYVPKNVVLESPVLNILSSGEETSIALFPRVIIIVEHGAKAEFVNLSTASKKQAQEAGPLSLVNSSIETYVGQNAGLSYLDVSDFSGNTFAVSRVYNEVKRDGSLHSSTVALGGWQIKSDIQTNLKEPGSKSDIRGVVLGAGSERYSFNTIQDHIAPDTGSTINFRVALKDSASSAYLGTIRVSKEAQRTDSYQSNKNLLLGSNAHADSIPKLEILADDVKCSHGATVGPADKEQIFYLMSRGLSNLEAEELIVTGFFRQVVQSCPVDGAGDWINELVADKIHA